MYHLPVGPALKLSQHNKVLPKLKHSLQHLQIRILLQIVAVVKAAGTSGLHVCYPLVLDRPWVRSPAVHIHIQ
jgi:hypothetical protein